MRSMLMTRARAMAAIVILACGGEASPATTSTTVSTGVPASVTIAPSIVPDVLVGATVTLLATVRSTTGLDLDIQVDWSSSNTAVATVSGGVVSGVAVGVATITATSGSKSASVTVTVNAAADPTQPPETLATLPLVYLDSRMPVAPAAGGSVITVGAGGNLQSALNNAQPGDVIELANGATFTGNFILPNKNTTSSKWIVIRASNRSLLPPEGVRMTPSIAAAMNLPKVMSASNVGAFQTAPGAHHYRLVGFEISVPATTSNTGLVRLGDDGGNGQRTVASIPTDLVIDRMYIHGTATGVVRRCIALNSASTSIVDSWISDCHESGADAQAIAGWNGPGPYKIVNNYVEGSGENLIFGGTDPGVPNLVPSDMEIRGNHFFKPVSWKGKWLVKNLLELKNAQRVLIEGNVLENNWQDGQGGAAVVLKTVNQQGSCTWCVTGDVTFRYNLIRNVGSGFSIAGSPDNAFPDIHARRLTIMDNIVVGINSSPTFNGDGRGLLFGGDPSDVVFAHNTVVDPTNVAIAFGPLGTSMQRITIRDNVFGGGQYGVKGDSRAGGTGSISTYMPNGTFTGNVVTLQSSTGYPGGNYYPTSLSAVGFVNFGAADVRLSAVSAYRGKGSDGRDPGADVAAVLSKTASAIVP